MKKTVFFDCSRRNVDFEEADLSLAVFGNCDLLNASFGKSIIEKTDFRSARSYFIDSEINKIKGARFSWPGVSGLLNKYGISIE